MTEIQQLAHSLEGEIRATKQLSELKQEDHKARASLPDMTEIVNRLHRVEVAQLSTRSQFAKWLLKLMEILKL